jgi:hypothetical protein
LRVAWLLFQLGLRRWANRLHAVLRRPKKASDPNAPRVATPRKSTVGWVWTALFFGLFIIQGATFSFQFLGKLVRHVERIDVGGRFGVTKWTLEILRRAEEKRSAVAEGATSDAYKALAAEVMLELHMEDVPLDARKTRTAVILHVFTIRGLQGFREVDPQAQRRALGGLNPFEGRSWPDEGGGRVVGALGLMLLALGVCQLFTMLGTGNQDLGRVEWSLEWLYTFPVPAGRLFLSKVLEYAVVNAYGWIMTAPLLGVFLWSAGYGGWAVPLAVAGTLISSSAVGSCRILLETWLRKSLPLNRLKNFQAGFTLLGVLMLMSVFAAAATPVLPAGLLDFITGFPVAASWNPFSVPAILCVGGGAAIGSGVAMLAAALLVPWAAVRLAQYFVRDGLLTTTGAYQGKRRAASASTGGGFHGVVGKDLRLLFRDRSFLVQTLVVPLVVLGFQLILNPSLLKNILSDHHHTAVAAYVVGAYALMNSAFQVLTVEGNTLWLLYTFPRDLHEILIRKTLLWCAFGMLYTVALLVAGLAVAPSLTGAALSGAVTAIVGVGIFAFVVAALGALGTDPLQTEVHRRMRTDMAYLSMLLLAQFAYSIYTPSVHQRVVQVVLFTLLALALWQKVRDRIPYLLDPTEAPPPRVALADGLVAILAFFVLQGMGMLLLARSGAPTGAAMLASYVAAGAVVASFSLYSFWRHKVPRILHAVGFRSEEGGVVRSVGWGLAAGAAGAGIAWAYLRVLDRFEVLRTMRDEALELRSGLDPSSIGWVAVLAVFAAPVFEEYLFRGLVYRGLRRTWSALPAVLASAFLFAIVHPPVSVVPVFGLGVLAALAFERGRRLVAPILAHMVYNGTVLFLN